MAKASSSSSSISKKNKGASELDISDRISAAVDTFNSNIIYSQSCTESSSDFCEQLMGIREQILGLNDKYFDNINKFVGNIGQYERKEPNYTLAQLSYILKNLPSQFPQIRNEMKVIDQIKITTKLTEYNGDFYLEKKRRDGKNLTTIYPKILDASIIRTGNLSTAVIMRLLYSYKDELNNIITRNVLVKVYPLELNRTYDRVVQSDSDVFKAVSRFIFIREALIGCWISINLLSNKSNNNRIPTTGTIMCVNDSYFVVGKRVRKTDLYREENYYGLPFTFDQYNNILDDDKIRNNPPEINKRWLTDHRGSIEEWESNVARRQYGYIEMEEASFSLEQLINKNQFTLGMFVEIIYTRLCMAYIGNVGIADDHANNIMVRRTSKIRKYIIKRRNTEYNFYIPDTLQIKYIDLERFNPYDNRNFFMIPVMDGSFYRYFKPNYAPHMPQPDRDIATEIFDLMIGDYNKIDLFAELMWRALPDKYLNENLYRDRPNDIISFYLDLDKMDGELAPNMLRKLSKEQLLLPLQKPYRLWNGRPIWNQNPNQPQQPIQPQQPNVQPNVQPNIQPQQPVQPQQQPIQPQQPIQQGRGRYILTI